MVAGTISNLLRDWTSLKNAIQMAIGLSMYGVNNVVLDVCGNGVMDNELCSRWMQLAAFMPLARNTYTDTYYNAATGKVEAADPFLPFNLDFNSELSYKAATYQKLQYSRYVYTELFLASIHGGAVVRPLFFDYPLDDNCYTADSESTYMLGSALKVSPVLTKGLVEGDNIFSYFPAGSWADLNTKKPFTSIGAQMEIATSLLSTSVHLKEGSVIPYLSLPAGVTTTRDMETKSTTSYYANRDTKMAAEGFILFDDGVSTDSISTNKYALWKVSVADKRIDFTPAAGDKDYLPVDYMVQMVTDVTIFNAEDLSTVVTACYFGAGTVAIPMTADYNMFSKYLQLKFTTNIAIGSIGYILFTDAAGTECN
jgi:alpha-glucosidase (family GH31 glycosyl hydrolase)